MATVYCLLNNVNHTLKKKIHGGKIDKVNIYHRVLMLVNIALDYSLVFYQANTVFPRDYLAEEERDGCLT